MCKVWLGRTEGKEEEKSNPLTSKSCATGTSREGGHAATKHRETEITITEATTAASTQPQSQGCQRGLGSSAWRAMPARDLGQGRSKAQCSLGPDQQPGVQDNHALHGSHVLTAPDSKAGKDKLLRVTILAGRHSGRPPCHLTGPNCTESSSPTHCPETQLGVLFG